MKYQDLLLAHGAFYKYENRAKFYDDRRSHLAYEILLIVTYT